MFAALHRGPQVSILEKRLVLGSGIERSQVPDTRGGLGIPLVHVEPVGAHWMAVARVSVPGMLQGLSQGGRSLLGVHGASSLH